MKEEKNNIIFRASWFKTLNRWQPEMVVEFITALENYYNENPVEITNDRVLDLWEQAQPLLDADRVVYKKRKDAARANGSLGGAPKGNTNAKKTTENNPQVDKTTENNQKQAKQPIEIENEIENEIEIEIEIETDIEKVKEQVDSNSYDKVFLKGKTLSNTNNGTNTRTREETDDTWIDEWLANRNK